MAGDGVVDIAAGAYADDDGAENAGAMYLMLLKTDGNVNRAQKISLLYGNINAYAVNMTSGFAARAGVGDVDGDGVLEMALGASGAIYIIHFQQTSCESHAPTNLPTPSPTKLSEKISGACYHHTSTVTRLMPDGHGTEQVPLANLVKRDRVLAVNEHTKPTFAKVIAILHNRAVEPYVRIVMKGKLKRELQVTLHHTFDACSNKRNPFKHALEPYRRFIVEAKDLKEGDCLHTIEGATMAHSIKHVAIKDGDVSYSVKLEGGVGTVAIGGVFTHALDYVLMPGRSNTQITQK